MVTSSTRQATYRSGSRGESLADTRRAELLPDDVQRRVRERLNEGCPYAYYFGALECEFRDGTLILRGRLPTFYLMQVLQSRLIGIDGVERLDNRVDVVSSVGLSSVRFK